MPTQEEILAQLIPTLQARLAQAPPPVESLTPDEEAEARQASEQSALARKYFSRDIVSEARKMAEDDLPKNRVLRALVGMGEGAAQYYNPKTFKSREDRAFDRLEKDYQRRAPVLQRDLAASEATTSRNEQKRLDRQAKLQIADQQDRQAAEKLLLANAKFLADDPERQAKVKALLASEAFTKSKTKARDLENLFMETNKTKMGTATSGMTEAAARRFNPELAAQMDKDANAAGLRKALFGGFEGQLRKLGATSSTSYSSPSETIQNIGGVPHLIQKPGQARTRVSGSDTLSPAFLQLFERFSGNALGTPTNGGAPAPGILGGGAASSSLPAVPPAGAKRGAVGISQSAGGVPQTARPAAQVAPGGDSGGLAVPAGSGLKITSLGGVAPKPLSGPMQQQMDVLNNISTSLDDSLDALSGFADKETKRLVEKEMKPVGGNFLGIIPTQNWKYTHDKREGEIIDWKDSKDSKRKTAYNQYVRVTSNLQRMQWLEAIRFSGKAINEGEQKFINGIMPSLSPNKTAIYDTPEQAMNKLIRMRVATSAIRLKMSLINKGEDQTFVQSINLADDMEKATQRLMGKYKKGDKLTAEDFNPRTNLPTLMKYAGDKLGSALGEGSASAPGSPAPAPSAAPPSVDNKSKWNAAYQEALKKAGVIK